MRGGFYRSLAALVIRRRAVVLAVYALATVALLWPASRITLRSDISDLLPRGTPSADDLRFFLERFGTADQIFVTLRAGPGAGVDDLEDAAAGLSESLRGTGLFHTVQYGITEQDILAMADLGMAHLPVLLPPEKQDELRRKLTPGAIRRALERARDAGTSGVLPLGPAKPLLARDPLGLLSLLPLPSSGEDSTVRPDPESGLFLSDDGSTLLMMATPVGPPQDSAFSRRLLSEMARAESSALEGFPGVTAEHAGAYEIAVQEEARLRHDITATAGISMGAILILYAVALRRPGLLLIVLVPLTLSMVWTLGVAGIVPGHLNMVTVAFAAILLGVGDDALTHLYLRFTEETSRGLAAPAAVVEAMASSGPSILIAGLTSGLSFGALVFVRFRGLSELGIIAAIGMVNLLISAFFLFPCLLASLPARRGAASPPPLARLSGAVAAFHRWGRPRRGRVLAAAGLVVAGAAVAAAAGLRFSPDLAALRGEDPAMDHLRSVLAPFGGLPESIHLVHDEGSLDASLEASEGALAAVRALAASGDVAAWSSPAAWIPSAARQRDNHAALAAIDWNGTARIFREEAARLGLREAFFAPFLDAVRHYGDLDAVRIDPSRLLAQDGSAAWLRGSISGTAVAARVLVAPGRDPAEVAASLAPHGRAASVARVVADLTALIRSDFRRGAIIALVMVVLATAASFRSARQMALVSVPVAAGTLLLLGGLAILEIPINLMNLVAVPLVFGLGVDFGVYLVNRHEEEGRTRVDLVLRHTGGAILLTGMTTLAGFGSLAAADFPGLRSMGWVALLGISGCLAASLLLLPLLLPDGAHPGTAGHREAAGPR